MSIEFILSKLTETEPVYIRTSDELNNFTNWNGSIIFCTKDKEFSITPKKDSLNSLVYFLKEYIFNFKRLVLTWNIKNLYSYFRFHIPSNFNKFYPNGNIIDIKYGESFYNIKQNIPNNFKEAYERCKVFAFDKNWKNINNKIYKPLATKVLPMMETKGVINKKDKQIVYSSYEIEGQLNGRLKCRELFENCINPHTLSSEIRECLIPRNFGQDLIFAELDFRHLEGSVLAWLSKDAKMINYINTDLYLNLSKVFFDVSRGISKFIFLILIYGGGDAEIATKLNISLDLAKQYRQAFNFEFPIASKWLDDKQSELKYNSMAIDYCGRHRIFENDFYKRRNFEIQSPSAFVCLEKLIKLNKYLGKFLVFNIHDSYVLAFPLNSKDRVLDIAKKVLESPSDILEGLSLKINIKIGKDLFNLKGI